MLPSLMRSFIIQKLNFFEFFVVLFFSLFSILILISACDMLSIYLVIELSALSFYVLASFKRNSSFSSEAGLTYFISGSYVTGLFLIGCSILYGLTGTLNFNNLMLIFCTSIMDNTYSQYTLLTLSIFIITFVFLFKLTVAPFHIWSPDVYEGAPLSSTIIFVLLPKISLFFVFIKWLFIIQTFTSIKTLLVFTGILSLLIGSFFSLRQKKLKRLIIFSSIAQIGFIVSALSIISINVNSFVSVIFFIAIYVITSTLIWSHIALYYTFQNKILTFKEAFHNPLYITNLSTLFSINKIWSISNLLLFFSLAGIPPLVGFFAKIFIVISLVETQDLNTAFIILMVSSISVFYYLRLIKIVFFENTIKHNTNFTQVVLTDFLTGYDSLVISFLLIFLVFCFFYPVFLLNIISIINFNFLFL